MIVILTGPESTGKTELSQDLAKFYDAGLIPEYAREYISRLNRSYTIKDLDLIARKQLEQMLTARESNESLIFIDTYLIITKIWFDVAFGKVPSWLDPEILKTFDVLYLLCKPDIPWTPDPLRENGGEMREALFCKYEEELKRAKLDYHYIEGRGKTRFTSAKNIINNYLTRSNGGTIWK